MNETKTEIYNINDKIKKDVRKTIIEVYTSLKDGGYDPKSQLIGYAISGDPIYIPRLNDARKIITAIDRNDFLEEMLEYYVQNHGDDE